MPMPTMHAAIALAMLVVANAAPWFAARVLRNRGDTAIDCSLTWPDGIRLLGDHKTWRGLMAAMLGCSVASHLLGQTAGLGLQFGALAMAGDALSSMAKRRLQLAPGTEVPALDSVPEALLPLLFTADALHLGASEITAVTVIFATLNAATAFLRHTTPKRVGRRRTP